MEIEEIKCSELWCLYNVEGRCIRDSIDLVATSKRIKDREGVEQIKIVLICGSAAQ